MIIKGIKIYGFGDLLSKEFVFADSGISRISVENEKDGQTIYDFCVSMLFGLSGRSEGGFRKKYYPGPMTRFGGEMVIDTTGKRYLISSSWGLVPSQDSIRLFELPGNRQVILKSGKTVGEQLLGITRAAFVSATFLDFDTPRGNFFGYLTPTLEFTRDRTASFAAIDRRFSKRLAEIKDNETKSGELDLLVLQKMAMSNELTRLSETDAKISAKKNELEKYAELLKNKKEELEACERRIKLAESCELLLEKDKINAALATEKADLLEIEREKLKIEALSDKKLWREIVKGCVVMSIPNYFKYKNRFTITKNGIQTDIREDLEELVLKQQRDTERLTELLGDMPLSKHIELWREAEEILRDADEDERRDATMAKIDEERLRAERLSGEIKPDEEKVQTIKDEIFALCENVSESYSEATAKLSGIDGKIKALTEEFKVKSLAQNAYKSALSETKNVLLADIIADAKKIARDTYNTGCNFIMDSQLGITAECDRDAVLPAYIAFRSAVAKKLFPGESLFPVFAVKNISLDAFPIEIKQVISVGM